MKALHSFLGALTLLAFKARALPYPADPTDFTVTSTKTATAMSIPVLTSPGPHSIIIISSSNAKPTTITLAQAQAQATPSPTATESSVTAEPIMTLPPQVLDSSTTTSFTGRCEYSFCYQGTNVCFYWAGVTSWDVSRGPLPGEIPTMLGPCESVVTTAATTAAATTVEEEQERATGVITRVF
ncbi:uncharacterized protein F4807DRAFT_457183 [Annulohypoxylon truncatum]|uniref:uncharacterized protein n=1 Tax=Annulohypoxylon truncatum TaxID=327061 RepID=UPI0020078C6A|nr:uncharacterized protein F4807DRAFT_457183 [Annulohypoxylon truncatum]KAI1213098.1 hypothetical protein F4807DRAFT_457183 [Annulohypoxylon truncatum]